jgi:gas vesicle protein
MIGMLAESIIVSFILGGIIGAITAMHLTQQHNNENKVPIRVKHDRNHRKRQ